MGSVASGLGPIVERGRMVVRRCTTVDGEGATEQRRLRWSRDDDPRLPSTPGASQGGSAVQPAAGQRPLTRFGLSPAALRTTQ
ncbi:hypothetical protein VTN77DRAFT_6744 [Rasamsonia byssochlamydoides]|uniref:uncharacterized protein n=1 Tax=Rasamsonia byssochlamydoides TaxID=89139 RepID=UPI00374215C2